MPHYIEYEGFIYDLEKLEVLINGEWVKLPTTDAPRVTLAIQEGKETTYDSTRTGESSGTPSE